MSKKDIFLVRMARFIGSNKILGIAVFNDSNDTNELICIDQDCIEKKIEYINNAYDSELRLKSFKDIGIEGLWAMEKKDFKFELVSL